MMGVKVKRKEFEGNVKVTVSEREVRLWVCNEEGLNIFRFKAIGEVHSQEDGVVVIGGDW